MSGTSTGSRTLAGDLRVKADKKHTSKLEQTVGTLFALAVAKAEEAAEAGSYSIQVFDGKLDDNTVASVLVKQLTGNGFEARVYEDTDYSEHVGTRMMCLEVKW